MTATLVAVMSAPASAQEQIEYYGLDHLGSVRVIFDQTGTVVDRMDYGPFGENLRAAIRFPTEQFAQLARDAETGQDHAQARNYAPRTGRFNRVDPVYAGLFNPQGWNRYVYATHSPVTFLDPAGLDLFRITSVPACSTFDCGALDYFYPPVYGETPIWFVARAPIFGGPGRTPNPPGTPDDPPTPDNPDRPDNPIPPDNPDPKNQDNDVLNCQARWGFSGTVSRYFGDTAGDIAFGAEVAGPLSLASDYFAIRAKARGALGTSNPYASGINRGIRAGSRAFGLQPSTMGTLLKVGNRLTVAAAVVGVFTSAYNGTIAVQCFAGVLK